MAFPEDLLKAEAGPGLAMAAAALVLPVLFPRLRPALHGVLKQGVTLFLEAEFDLDGEIADELVGHTIGRLLDILAAPEPAAVRRARIERQVQRFEARARERADRHGWSEADKARRYTRHVAKLQDAIADRRHTCPERDVKLLQHASEVVSEDW